MSWREGPSRGVWWCAGLVLLVGCGASEAPALLDAGLLEDAATIDVGRDTGGLADLGPTDLGPTDLGTTDLGTPVDAGFDDRGQPVDTGVVDPPFDVLRVGATWTYRTTELATGTTQDLLTTIEAFEDIGGMAAGKMGFRIRKAKLNGGASVSWDSDVGGSIIGRVRDQNVNASGALTSEEFYDPYRTRLDESAAHTMLGATWTESYAQTDLNPPAAPVLANKTATWTVEAVDEVVTVPAGTFTCLRVRRDAGTSPKTYWFARGVGKVREEGGQTVLLVDYNIPP